MSGIFGYLHPSNIFHISDAEVEKLKIWNVPYGTAKDDMISTPKLCLGCCLDNISEFPIPDNLILQSDRKFAVIDALIYNRDELLEKCHVPTDCTDEELLFQYINLHGTNALKDVNGDFCGAIYDENDESLILFRDHMGIRPLFYYCDRNILVFSTDIRGIIAFPYCDTAINEEWLYKSICGFAIDGTETTEFANILCVPPATAIHYVIKNGSIHSHRQTYWKPRQKRIHLSSEQEYITQLKELITDSVQRRLNAIPGTVGAELSGGLDSGIIDILINRLNRDCIYHSWSIDPAKLPLAEEDERLIIFDICNQEKISCHYSDMYLLLGEGSNMASNIAKTGIPISDDDDTILQCVFPPYINTLQIYSTAEFMNKQDVKIIFSGHGGDEGVSHRSNPYELFYHHEYIHYLNYMYSIDQNTKWKLLHTLKSCYRNIFKTGKKFKKPFRSPLSSPELLKKDLADAFNDNSMAKHKYAYDPVGYILDGGSRNRLDVTALLGAYGGARYVFPYLDYRVLDFAVSIPRYLYLKNGQNRYIFREAFKDIMPSSLYSLRQKANTSKKNLPPNENWYEAFAVSKVYITNKLDKAYWDKYLDYQVIEDWLQRGKPINNDERRRDENIHASLTTCLQLQNLITKVRGSLSLP